MTIHVYTKYRVHAFRDNFVILARIEHDPIEENDRINCLQRTVCHSLASGRILSVIRETRPCEISVP